MATCAEIEIINNERKIVKHIRKFGYFVVRVEGIKGSPAFSYSMGIQSTLGAPECIVVGLDGDLSFELISEYFYRTSFGEPFEQGRLYEFNNARHIPVNVYFNKVPDGYHPQYLACAVWFYRSGRFDAIQLIYSNPDGIFPWDNNVTEEFKNKQMILSPKIFNHKRS
jgi:hypothetical protein